MMGPRTVDILETYFTFDKTGRSHLEYKYILTRGLCSDSQEIFVGTRTESQSTVQTQDEHITVTCGHSLRHMNQSDPD